jgi:hypothetical protein
VTSGFIASSIGSETGAPGMAASLGGPGLVLSARRVGVVESGRASHRAVYFGVAYGEGVLDGQRRDTSTSRRDIEAIAGIGWRCWPSLTFRDGRTPECQESREESASAPMWYR